MDVLELLRLLCEGHNIEMQDYLRVQKTQVISHDLVTEIYLFLLALELRRKLVGRSRRRLQTITRALVCPPGSRAQPELDETNVGQAKKAVDILVELVQGNTSRGNSNLLLQTKLVAILERVVEKKTLGDSGADYELNELRVSSLVLLEALLEGSSAEQCGRMLRVLDIGSLARATAKSYDAA
eukprot:1588813-Prymnesium_polylepis.1